MPESIIDHQWAAVCKIAHMRVSCFSFALKGSEVKHVELDMEMALSIFLEVISKYRNKEGTFLETPESL